jgi:hypothetical protein
MRGVGLPGRTLDPHVIADTYQGSAQSAERSQKLTKASSFIAKVLAVYSEKMACDIQTWNGSTKYMVPVLTKGGLNSDNEVYGVLELPEVGDMVIIDFLEGREGMPMIIGTVLPFYNKYFQDNQTPINSGSKAFTLKLLEKDLPKTFRKIFRSGTTIEIQEDGSLIVETPSGTYIQLDEANGVIKVEDPDGNLFTINSDGVKIEDTNGNDITMGSGKVTINGNLEVAQ